MNGPLPATTASATSNAALPVRAASTWSDAAGMAGAVEDLEVRRTIASSPGSAVATPELSWRAISNVCSSTVPQLVGLPNTARPRSLEVALAPSPEPTGAGESPRMLAPVGGGGSPWMLASPSALGRSRVPAVSPSPSLRELIALAVMWAGAVPARPLPLLRLPTSFFWLASLSPLSGSSLALATMLALSTRASKSSRGIVIRLFMPRVVGVSSVPSTPPGSAGT
mmetsp:Transcript_83779/g.159995  ORF Transcript_83779/g.159995 Transcript_83779/m.159995 type:complete len:225 (-) Transcript_83779:269-943(-)